MLLLLTFLTTLTAGFILHLHFVARDEGEYVARAGRLAREPGLRGEIRGRLPRARVLEVVCDPAIAAHFAEAVRFMQAEGPGRPGPPVLVEAGARPRTPTIGP